ncbi:MAG: formyl transferase [Thermodesulfobacteriota bacterium]
MKTDSIEKSHPLSVVVIVSPDISDIYFANQLIKRVNVKAVFVEGQDADDGAATARLRRGLKYIAEPHRIADRIKEELYGKKLRQKAESILLAGFGEEGLEIDTRGRPVKVVYTKGVNAINDYEYVKAIEETAPDVIALCGASIIKKPIISIPAKGALNLHGGLAQWYRGVWTTLWAIYNEEPEYVGATVHYVSEGIDDGNIIYQGRPDITSGDNHESLYVKVVKLGVELMVKAIEDIEEGNVKSRPLEKKGALYLKNRVTAEVIRDTWRKVEKGVIESYLINKKQRDKKVKLAI